MRAICFALLTLVSFQCWGKSPSSIASVVRTVTSVPVFKETAISPDGRWVAWVESTSSASCGSYTCSLIYVSPRHGSAKPLRISAASGNAVTPRLEEHAIAWSPDSRSLAFLSNAQSPSQDELYVVRLADRHLAKLTHVKGYLETPKWSPNGTQIAFLFTKNARRAAGPLGPNPPQTGVIGQKVHEQRIAVVSLRTDALRLMTPDDLYVYEYDWSPSGHAFVATAAHGNGDNNWYTAALYRFDAGHPPRVLLHPHEQIAVPRWSPDGRRIAFVSGLMSDEGVANGDVYVIPAVGGTVRHIGRLSGSAMWLKWQPNSRDLLLVETRHGGSAIDLLDTNTGLVKSLWRSGERIRAQANFALGLSVARDGRTSAVIRASFTEPPGVWTGPIGAWTRKTSEPVLASLPWKAATSIEWRSGRWKPQGWLLAPRTIKAGRKYPLVVWVHGGPAWANMPTWPIPSAGTYGALLAGVGYFVFLPNPRGSAGFGEAFEHANVRDFGGGDLRDILRGIKRVESVAPIDDHRVGIGGWSYGGYMSMWALTQTRRFRAAFIGAGLSDWRSYAGENGIDEWMMAYFGGSVYDDPAVYAKSSPMHFVRNVRTPALLAVGEDDDECPAPQSYEYWDALKHFGVKTELVVYANEGHEFVNPKDKLNVLKRMVAWFQENMPPSSTP